MKRSPLQRRTPLSSRSSLERRTAPKRKPISPASKAQREKVKGSVCRSCGDELVHPAHVIDRSLGGCNDPLCVLPLCPSCHRDYDGGKAEVLPFLSKAEQAHAVGHVGIVSALKRTTNLHWVPEEHGKEST